MPKLSYQSNLRREVAFSFSGKVVGIREWLSFLPTTWFVQALPFLNEPGVKEHSVKYQCSISPASDAKNPTNQGRKGLLSGLKRNGRSKVMQEAARTGKA